MIAGIEGITTKAAVTKIVAMKATVMRAAGTITDAEMMTVKMGTAGVRGAAGTKY
jgi:hypothetical protein